MASTNKTTHYELSQYIGSDKPTYLVDYNTDMANIDSGIYAAKSEADNNTNSIGNLSNLTTTDKSSLVEAINEVNEETSQIGNLSNLTTSANNNLVSAINEVDAEADANNQNIGTMTNLETTVKTSLVGAINEVNTLSKNNDESIGNLSNLKTSVKNNLVGAINEVETNVEKFNLTNIVTTSVSNLSITNGSSVADGTTQGITVATNSDGSVGKVYGNILINTNSGSSNPTVTLGTSALRPKTNITINNIGYIFVSAGSTFDMYPLSININTNGRITMAGKNASYITRNRIQILPCILFMEDFGDR